MNKYWCICKIDLIFYYGDRQMCTKFSFKNLTFSLVSQERQFWDLSGQLTCNFFWDAGFSNINTSKKVRNRFIKIWFLCYQDRQNHTSESMSRVKDLSDGLGKGLFLQALKCLFPPSSRLVSIWFKSAKFPPRENCLNPCNQHLIWKSLMVIDKSKKIH